MGCEECEQERMPVLFIVINNFSHDHRFMITSILVFPETAAGVHALDFFFFGWSWSESLCLSG